MVAREIVQRTCRAYGQANLIPNTAAGPLTEDPVSALCTITYNPAAKTEIIKLFICIEIMTQKIGED